jgi:glutathione S-transferase
MPMNCRKTFEVWVPPENATQDISRVKEIWERCRSQFKEIGPWLFGDFSIADCMYAPVVMRFHTYGIELGELESEYVTTMKNHPAILEWLSASRDETESIGKYEFNG